MLGTYFAYWNRLSSPYLSLSLSLFSNSLSIRSAAVFPQWTISHVPLSVPASERFMALALYVSVRFYRWLFLCFHARTRAHKFEWDQSFPSNKKKKYGDEGKDNLEFDFYFFYSSFSLFLVLYYIFLLYMNSESTDWQINSSSDHVRLWRSQSNIYSTTVKRIH